MASMLTGGCGAGSIFRRHLRGFPRFDRYNHPAGGQPFDARDSDGAQHPVDGAIRHVIITIAVPHRRNERKFMNKNTR
jgi:hypothetical protein